MKVLFICTGNMCRSPMAEVSLRQRIERDEVEDVHVESAGLGGWVDSPATDEAIAVAATEHGVDLSSHRSQAVSSALLAECHVIVVMTPEHRIQVEAICPERSDDIYLIRAFERGREPLPMAGPLADPVMKPVEEYQRCFATIETCLDHFWSWLQSRGAI